MEDNKKENDLKITNEYDENSLEYKYSQHFNLLKYEDTLLNREQNLKSSLIIISGLDLRQTKIILKESDSKLKEWKFEPEKNVLENIINTIRKDIEFNLIDSKEFKITKIIEKLEQEGDFLKLYTNYDFVKYDFENVDNDIEIQSIEDYIKIKKNYNLSFEEIQSLSKKQKRYLLYKLKNN